MKKNILIAVILVLIGITLILLKIYGKGQEQGVIVLSGNVEVTEINIGFKSSGRIEELLAEEGQQVQTGEKLAVIDSAEAESQAVQSRALMHESEARLKELKEGSRSQDIEQANASIRAANAELEKAKKDHDRYQSLYKNGAVSAQQVDSVEKSYEVALAQQQKAAAALSLIKEGPRKEDIKAAESRLHQAEAMVKTYEIRLKDSVISSPVSGVILRKNNELGEIVAPGVPVYTIGDLDNPWVKVYVKEDKLGLVKLGQKAEVRTDTYPDKKYEGEIIYISSEAEFTPKNVQTQEERVKLVFGVKVSVKNINDELKPGMPADVKIFLK
ncbi:MAG: ABC transporter substrate-binding protein [Nitrospirae bacterium GWC2_42_7]|nr:MAG: ABC transporter substrate-binding protein [Nitrospirae bacterium GWC2_42_7]